MEISMNDKSIFLDESGVDFTPYKKIADKIDQCLSLISYHRIFQNTSEMLKKEAELSSLRQQIKHIKRRTHR